MQKNGAFNLNHKMSENEKRNPLANSNGISFKSYFDILIRKRCQKCVQHSMIKSREFFFFPFGMFSHFPFLFCLVILLSFRLIFIFARVMTSHSIAGGGYSIFNRIKHPFSINRVCFCLESQGEIIILI